MVLKDILFGLSVLSGVALAGQLEDSINLKVTAFVTPESCYFDESASKILELGNINIKEFGDGKPADLKLTTNATMKFNCEIGTEAKFNFAAIAEEACMVTSGASYSCGGENKSIGITPKISFKDPANIARAYRVFNDSTDRERVNEIALDNKVGVININEVQLRMVKDKELTPGEISSNYIVKVWGD